MLKDMIAYSLDSESIVLLDNMCILFKFIKNKLFIWIKTLLKYFKKSCE